MKIILNFNKSDSLTALSLLRLAALPRQAGPAQAAGAPAAGKPDLEARRPGACHRSQVWRDRGIRERPKSRHYVLCSSSQQHSKTLFGQPVNVAPSDWAGSRYRGGTGGGRLTRLGRHESLCRHLDKSLGVTA